MNQRISMNIDDLIELLKPHTKEVIMTTDKKTIDSFFDDKENVQSTRSIFKNGVTIHFLELESK